LAEAGKRRRTFFVEPDIAADDLATRDDRRSMFLVDPSRPDEDLAVKKDCKRIDVADPANVVAEATATPMMPLIVAMDQSRVRVKSPAATVNASPVPMAFAEAREPWNSRLPPDEASNTPK